MSGCSRPGQGPVSRFYQGAVAGAALLLVACVPPTPFFLEEGGAASAPRPAGSGTAARARSAQLQAACRVELRTVVDARRDPTTLGSLAGRPVRPPADPEAWLVSSLQGLREEGIEILRELPSGETADLAVDAELRMAWVNSVRANKTANVVVVLSYLDGVGEPVEVPFRGTDASANWSSTDAEITRMFDRVFARLVKSMASDIQSRCHQ